MGVIVVAFVGHEVWAVFITAHVFKHRMSQTGAVLSTLVVVWRVYMNSKSLSLVSTSSCLSALLPLSQWQILLPQ